MSPENTLPKRHLDARTFQVPLDELAVTMLYKVQREGPAIVSKPDFVCADIYYLMRQAHHTCSLLFFINADRRRKEDVDWRVAYSAVTLPLVRTMIDCLYNITAILQSPGPKGYQFRASGLRQMLEALETDRTRYGGEPAWDAYIAERHAKIDFELRRNGLSEAEVRATPYWQTLSAYLRLKKNAAPTPHQQFLRRLTYGFWQEYSGISHASFQGLLPIGVFLAPKDLEHEVRPIVEGEGVELLIARHMPRVAGILLCILTEVQAHFRFQGARIGERLRQIWNSLLVAPEIRELHDERYAQLMTDSGINPN
jgi:hypothetical protein